MSSESRNKSYSSTDDSEHEDSFFDTNASKWKMRYLSRLGIYYNEKPTKLIEFLSIIEPEEFGETQANIDRDHTSLLELMAVYWDFTFKFDRRDSSKKTTKKEVKLAKQETEKAIKKLEEKDLNDFLNPNGKIEKESLDMFCKRKHILIDFFVYFRDLLERWWTVNQREERFTYLFMLFSRVCLLRPEPGETYKKILKFEKHKAIGGMADVRFVVHSSKKVLAITEAKLETCMLKRKMKRKSVIETQLPSTVLAQHIAELLMEKENSFFDSGVAGILCIGTLVFFTFLEIEEEHYKRILKNSKAEKMDKARIYYTCPLDFMRAEDRKKILKPLLQLAFIQSQDGVAC